MNRQILVATLLSLSIFNQARSTQTARPPQFVVFGFDGSKNINFWKDSRAFTQSMSSKDISVPFTYFLSGVVFLKDSQKKLYKGPKHSAGDSEISFGGTQAELLDRIQQVNLAVNEGHEMASHANGHFDGGVEKWSEGDWMLEFKIFNDLISNIKANNALPSNTESLAINAEKDIVGFRAPYLGVTTGLWSTLKNYKYQYDTSRVAEANYWPKKINQIWNFPLAMLRIADTNKKTLSMDYNFYLADSGAKPDPANASVYRSRMKRTYLKYFNDNYKGNRAPLHIGHHFSLWNGGAYYAALKDFAEEVCAKPEVKCVTYKELVKFMENLDERTLDTYQRGLFERDNAPEMMLSLNKLNTKTKVYTETELEKLGIQVDPPEAHEN
jgi:hypothetical protein